ncbi:MAG: recombinase RecA [Planctomycetes bacterium]|nr:recombinase RecA [Planctomycetota bacterium]
MSKSGKADGKKEPAERADGELDRKREQALDAAVKQIEKSYGVGSIMRLAEDQIVSVPGIPTGALSLDLALGGQGMPRGRICELFGPESSGKTTLALHVIAGAQKLGGIAAFIDAEHAMDPTWARKLGVNLEQLLVSQPDTGEQALEICEMLVRSNAVDVIAIDSVAALIPKAEIEGEMGDSHMGLQARLMSQAMRKLVGAVAKSRTCIIFINQIRMKIGVMFGNPETTPGGNALKFYSSVRIDVRRIQTIKEGENAVGSRVRARVVKNKVAPPFRTAEFDIMFDSGISAIGDLMDLGLTYGVVDKAGSWLSFGDTRLGQGREAARTFLAGNKDLLDEIRKAVVAKAIENPANVGLPASPDKAEAEESSEKEG